MWKLSTALAVILLLADQAAALPGNTTALSYVIPPPVSNGGKAWKAAQLRATSLMNNMTIEEKLTIVNGQDGPCAGNTAAIPRLGIPSMCYQDGPAGVRPAFGTTQFPAGVSTAATWDKDLMYQRGHAMGKEFRDIGAHGSLGMVTGGPLGRSPLGGRNWEGWYSDPYATGEASWYSVKGMVDAGVQTVSKHFIGYEQDTFRNPYGNTTEGYAIYPAQQQAPISANVDDRTTHELYMWGFAEAVRAGTTHVMCSYNLVNGTHACANSESLNGLLKGELNFQGAVMSDWGGTWGTETHVEGGLDMNMPGVGYGGAYGTFYGDDLLQMVQNGTISESRLNDMVVRSITPLITTGQIDDPLDEPAFNAVGTTLWPGDTYYRNVQNKSTVDLVRKISADGTILLKNSGSLPLKNPNNIAVFGQDAGPSPVGSQACGNYFDSCDITQNNGTLSLGAGSGYAWPQNLITPLEAIQQKALETQAHVQYILDNSQITLIEEMASGSLIPISQPDVCLVFAERYQTEGMDRNDLNLNIGNWSLAEDVILATASQCNNTVVVLHVGGAINMEKWIDNPNVTAVVMPLMPGEQAGPGLVDVLWGDVSPSAKLPFTIAKNESDYPPNTIVSDHTTTPQADFTEQLKIDYRWFDTYNITPRFEFGFGLSYSEFTYSSISLQTTLKNDSTSIQETNEVFEGQSSGQSIYDVIAEVSAVVKNVGKVDASEVAQLYLEFPSVEDEPPKVLRGFEKLKDICAGSNKTAKFDIRRKDVMVWDVVKQKWRLPNGEVTFHVGASSRNLPLSTSHTF